MDKPKIVFIHIPRTGGTTMRLSFFRNYNREKDAWIIKASSLGWRSIWRGLPGRQVQMHPDMENRPYVSGHTKLDDLRFLKKRGYSFVGMMRDPIERTISHYDWVLKRQIDRISQDWKERVLSTTLLEFTKIYENFQYKVMCGYDLSIFDYIGFCETYEKSLRKIGEMFGLNMVHGIHAKKTKSEDRTIATEEEREKMMPYLEKDYKLYNIARKLYDVS